MKKKIVCFIVLFIGIVSIMPAQTDQFFLDLNGVIMFYPGFETNIGWSRFVFNDRLGFIGNARYIGTFASIPNDEEFVTKAIHNIGLMAGGVFNILGYDKIFRPNLYAKIGCGYYISNSSYFRLLWAVGLNLDVYLSDAFAFSAGAGLDTDFFKFSLGMKLSKTIRR